MFTNQNKLITHSFFMRLALAQAQKNLGNTNENPSVGCVITKKNLVISAGSTSVNGRPHAEINAIKSSKTKLAGSQIYLTLEPCSHYGFTPPCTKEIINQKLKKVFFSTHDLDIRSYNKSKLTFNKKKIYLNKGLCKKEINNFYRSYFKSKISLLPFVSSKLAISKDFFTVNKKKRWITNFFSRSRGHLIRSQHDCIITSSKTVIDDNPRLTCRIDGLLDKSPSRIILDNKLKTPITSNIIKEANKYRTLIFYNKGDEKRIRELKRSKVEVYKVPMDEDNNLDLQQVLLKAKDLGFYRILLESGSKLTFNFLNKNLIDDLYLFVSNKKLGKLGKNNIKKDLKFFVADKKNLKHKVYLFGERLISYRIKKNV